MELSVFGLATIILALLTVAEGADECQRNEVCVAKEQCVDGKVDTIGQHILGPRIKLPCDGYDMQCCVYDPPADSSDEDSEEPSQGATSTTESPEDPGWSAQCGMRSVDTTSTDVSTNTTRFEFPWNVALFNVKMLLNQPKNEFLCGGTLIDDYIVVTGARCVHQRPIDTLRVHVGRWNLEAAREPRTQEIAVERVISHPGYVSSSQLNNIALVVLASAVYLGRAANRICLPAPTVNYYGGGALCYVTGWRNIPHRDNTNQQLKLRTGFYDQDQCTQQIRGITGSRVFRLPKVNLCSDYVDGQPDCPRAPGSALVCESPDDDRRQLKHQMFLVGIASHAVREACDSKAPEVFLNTSAYISWIDKHITELGRENTFSRPDPIYADD